MSWARFDDNMATHPKCAPLSDVAFRLMVHANLWARAQRTGGFVPQDMLATLLPGRTLKALALAAEELVAVGKTMHRVGLWEPGDGGWHIHDFDNYGGPGGSDTRSHGESTRAAAGDPALSWKRAEAGRRGGQASGLARSRLAAPDDTSKHVASSSEANGSKQGASSAEANGPKQSASHGDARALSSEVPNPIPDPYPLNKSLLLSSEANEQESKQDVRSKLAPPANTTGLRVSDEGATLCERAKSYLRNSRIAEEAYGSPLEWPELQAIWRGFESVWGKADRPRETTDPRVKVVLERFASGRTPDELLLAISASKRYAPVADNPSYQRIKTLLKDEEQVDNLLRLAKAPPLRNGRVPLKQYGGWSAPTTERLEHE